MNLFPFKSARKYQDRFMADVKEVVEEGGTLFAEVPTGVGKTSAVLSSSLEKSLEDGYRVLFLTPRHSQHMIVLETVSLINRKGHMIRVSDLVGKKWLCNIDGIEFLTNAEFNDYCRIIRDEEKCEYYNNTYNNGRLTRDAYDAIEGAGSVESSEALKRRCHFLCPYEIAIALARRSEVVVADYFHLFSPARDSFLSRIGGKLGNFIIIVDEAHNLPDRIRSNMSRKLSATMIERGIKEAKLFGFNDAVPLLKHIKAVFREKGERMMSREEFVGHIEKESDMVEAAEFLIRSGEEIKKERKRSYLSSIGNFLLEWHEAGHEYAFIYRNLERSELSLACLDPSVFSKPVIDSAHASIFMSGTLRPIEMYARLLGGSDAVLRSYPSPFPKSNRMDIILTSVTSRFSKRDDENMGRISLIIDHLLDMIRWSMAFFFPSYSFMKKIHSKIRRKDRVMMEKQGMTKGEREGFYRSFLSSNKVLFGVSSGSFSEGIDYPGNKIKLVGIVGLPLGNPDLETQFLIDYYERKFGSGWNYAYAFPAIIKAIQAAGRSIRSEKDRGVIVYMDERFAWKNYRRLLPEGAEVVDRLPYEKIVNFLR